MQPALKEPAYISIPSTVPLKYRSNCPSARQFYEHLKLAEDFSPIKKALLSEGVCKSEKRANELVDAWIQWFAVGATSFTKSYVMVEGPVDKVFHQMILNTTWYFNFCYKHTGVYTHHDPLTDEQKADPATGAALSETLERLVKVFGNDLHSELKHWVNRHKTGTLSVQSVSCTGNDGPFDIIPK